MKILKTNFYDVITSVLHCVAFLAFTLLSICVAGGLGFTTDKIGMSLLWPALCSVILQPIIFGRVCMALVLKEEGIKLILTTNAFYAKIIKYKLAGYSCLKNVICRDAWYC